MQQPPTTSKFDNLVARGLVRADARPKIKFTWFNFILSVLLLVVIYCDIFAKPLLAEIASYSFQIDIIAIVFKWAIISFGAYVVIFVRTLPIPQQVIITGFVVAVSLNLARALYSEKGTTITTCIILGMILFYIVRLLYNSSIYEENTMKDQRIRDLENIVQGMRRIHDRDTEKHFNGYDATKDHSS